MNYLAEGYLKAMDVEFRTMASADKRTAQRKVVDYQKEYDRLSVRFNASKTKAESEVVEKCCD